MVQKLCTATGGYLNTYLTIFNIKFLNVKKVELSKKYAYNDRPMSHSNVTLAEHFIETTLLYGIFSFSQKMTYRPFEIGLQKKLFRRYRVKSNRKFKDKR